MKNIFNNPMQNAASKIQESFATKEHFDKWYATLPKWLPEELDREAQDQINGDIPDYEKH